MTNTDKELTKDPRRPVCSDHGNYNEHGECRECQEQIAAFWALFDGQ